MTSTDDEHELETPTGPAWKRYEEDVKAFLDSMDDSTVTLDVRRVGVRSKVERQIDVLVERDVTTAKATIAVECKHYAKPLGIGKIDEFAGKLADLEVTSGVLYALNGVTSGARARADGAYPQILVRDLSPGARPPRPWEEYVADVTKFGDCGVPGCTFGDVDWRDWPQPDGTTVRAGACSACAAWSVSCERGETSYFVGDEEKCPACGRVYALERDRDGEVEGVAISSGPVE